jgi:hypothetical protein
MDVTRFKIDSYSVQIFGTDSKGRRTRWGDKVIRLYSNDNEAAQAVFAKTGHEIPEPYFSAGKIYYFAESDQFPAVIDLLRNERPVYIVWEPVHDPKEPNDGDAYFETIAGQRK